MTQVTAGKTIPVTPATPFERRISVGHNETNNDGGAVSFTADQWAWIEYTLPEDLHLSGALAIWKDWLVGDHGYAAIAAPGAAHTLTVEAASAQKDVDLGTGNEVLAANYDPTVVGKPVWVEFWDYTSSSRDTNKDLRELREVDSVSGTVVTLKENLSDTHPITTTRLIPLYGMFTTPRGTKNLDGGIFFIGTGSRPVGSPDRSEVTALISAGLCVCLRAKATSTVGTRELAVTFEMRRPES